MKKAIAATVSWLTRLKVANRQVNFFGVKVPIDQNRLAPVRYGYDKDDKSTPFVESRLSALLAMYPDYSTTRAARNWLAYADFVQLRNKEGGFSDGFDMDDIDLEVRHERYVVPNALTRHRDKAVQLFQDLGKIRRLPNGEWENNLSARITRFSPPAGGICIQPAYYFEQVGTNITVDWASGVLADGVSPDATIRSLIERPKNNRLPDLKDSMLANTLGVAAQVICSDGRILIPIRGNEQAIMADKKGKFHCSASGVFEWPDIAPNQKVLFDVFVSGMRNEIWRELRQEAHEYCIFPLGFARELPRAGKPQLFFGVESKLTLSEAEQRMKFAEESWEFIDPEELPLDSQLRSLLDDPERIERNESLIETCFTFEGWAAINLMRCYLDKTAFLE